MQSNTGYEHCQQHEEYSGCKAEGRQDRGRPGGRIGRRHAGPGGQHNRAQSRRGSGEERISISCGENCEKCCDTGDTQRSLSLLSFTPLLFVFASMTHLSFSFLVSILSFLLSTVSSVPSLLFSSSLLTSHALHLVRSYSTDALQAASFPCPSISIFTLLLKPHVIAYY